MREYKGRIKGTRQERFLRVAPTLLRQSYSTPYEGRLNAKRSQGIPPNEVTRKLLRLSEPTFNHEVTRPDRCYPHVCSLTTHQKGTASSKSPPALRNARTTSGVMMLLVASVMVLTSTSTGRSLVAIARMRLTISGMSGGPVKWMSVVEYGLPLSFHSLEMVSGPGWAAVRPSSGASSATDCLSES